MSSTYCYFCTKTFKAFLFWNNNRITESYKNHVLKNVKTQEQAGTPLVSSQWWHHHWSRSMWKTSLSYAWENENEDGEEHFSAIMKTFLILCFDWYYVWKYVFWTPERVSGTCRPHIENYCASKWNIKCQDMYFIHTELVLCLKRAEEVPQRGCPRSKSLLGFGDWPNYYRKPNSSARSWGVYVCGKHPGYINHNFIIC